MYTRSRSSTGGPGAGFTGGRGGMNSGNGNFQGPNSYNNHQGGNYQQQPNFKPGMTPQQGQQQQQQQQQPFTKAGDSPGTPLGQQQQQQQQAMKNRQPFQNPNQNRNPQTPQQQQQNLTPSTPKLKPILKQSGTPAATDAQNPSTPTPVPPPASTPSTNQAAPNTPNKNPVGTIKTSPATPAPNSLKAAPVAADDSAKNPDNTTESTDNMDSDDPRRWVDDESGKWMDTDDQSGQWMDTEDGQQQIPKWRRFKKLSNNKPNKKLKRLRMNQRLRKTLMPKNAIMVLNEMKAGVQFTFPETQAIMPNSLFLVHAELEGKVYVGQGLSKPLARQNAAENALKCLLLEKMTAAAMKERVDTDGDAAMEASDSQPAAAGEEKPQAQDAPKEGEAAAAAGEETATPEEGDDIPWSSLASFALYKLFLEWQNQGTVVPIPRPGVPPLPKNRADPKPAAEKVLPPNALEIHPVMLLNQMRPGTTYNEVGRVGNPPNIMFTLGVEINGQAYTGSAKNKKDAKKMAAKEALKALYNLEYPEEPKTEGTEMATQ